MSDRLDRVIEAAVKWAVATEAGQVTDFHQELFDAVKAAALLPGELTFTLRSKDRVSARAIKAWMTFAEQEHAPERNLNEVRQKLSAWENWQNDIANIRNLKVPD